MPKLFLIFSHTLTPEQKTEALNKLGVSEIITLPMEIQNLWSQVSPKGELNTRTIADIGAWLIKNGSPDDYILVQGEFGMTYLLVDWCFKRNFIPIYATSERVYQEEHLEDGTIERKHIFKHVNFRKYLRGGQ